MAKTLRRTGADRGARRNPRSGAISHRPGDVATSLPYCFECKDQQRVSLWKWWEQACGQAFGNHMPVLVIRSEQRPPLAVVSLDTLANLLAKERQLGERLVETNACRQDSRSDDQRARLSSTGKRQGRWKRRVDGTVVRRK